MPIMPHNGVVQTTEYNTDNFLGYNRGLKINSGEFFYTRNLTADYAPVAGERRKRGIVRTLTTPHGILSKADMYYVDGTKLYKDGEEINGITLTDDDKQLVSLGAYLLIWPDKIWYNTADGTHGEMDYSFTGSVTFAPENDDGAVQKDTIEFSTDTKPDIKAGDSMVISGSSVDENNSKSVVVKDVFYSDAEQKCTLTFVKEFITTGVRIEYTIQDHATAGEWYFITLEKPVREIGKWSFEVASNLVAGDKIRFDIPGAGPCSCVSIHEGVETTLEWRMGGGAEGDIELFSFTTTDISHDESGITISRTAPDMDFMIESQNRVWGCKYGLVDGEMINEIYCCALGDVRNWEKYEGISTDSWRASCGTDGPFTGAITFMNYPLFFKEKVLHKVYVSATGAHQIVTNEMRGVEEGCSRSLAIVNEVLYYKSRNYVCAYDGSQPIGISTALGDIDYDNAVAGGWGSKLYMSMEDKEHNWHLFTYDVAKGLWMREDDTQVRWFSEATEDLYYIDSYRRLCCVNGSTGTPEGAISWEAVSGVVGYEYRDHKYLSRFDLRMSLTPGSWMKLWIEYDSNGEWVPVGTMKGKRLQSFMLPVKPRRCDHLRFRLTGQGSFRLYSFARILELGSDHR